MLFIASSGHVASTGWFYGSREVRAHAVRHSWRHACVPLILVLVTIVVLGGAALEAASHPHDRGRPFRVLYGMYLGTVMAHFVIDAGLWRLRDSFPRRFLASRMPYLLRPAIDRQTTERATAARRPPGSGGRPGRRTLSLPAGPSPEAAATSIAADLLYAFA